MNDKVALKSGDLLRGSISRQEANIMIVVKPFALTMKTAKVISRPLPQPRPNYTPSRQQ